MACQLLPDALLADAEVLNGPHVAELVHSQVCVAPAVGHWVHRRTRWAVHSSFKGHNAMISEIQYKKRKEKGHKGNMHLYRFTRLKVDLSGIICSQD